MEYWIGVFFLFFIELFFKPQLQKKIEKQHLKMKIILKCQSFEIKCQWINNCNNDMLLFILLWLNKHIYFYTIKLLFLPGWRRERGGGTFPWAGGLRQHLRQGGEGWGGRPVGGHLRGFAGAAEDGAVRLRPAGVVPQRRQRGRALIQEPVQNFYQKYIFKCNQKCIIRI